MVRAEGEGKNIADYGRGEAPTYVTPHHSAIFIPSKRGGGERRTSMYKQEFVYAPRYISTLRLRCLNCVPLRFVVS